MSLTAARYEDKKASNGRPLYCSRDGERQSKCPTEHRTHRCCVGERQRVGGSSSRCDRWPENTREHARQRLVATAQADFRLRVAKHAKAWWAHLQSLKSNAAVLSRPQQRLGLQGSPQCAMRARTIVVGCPDEAACRTQNRRARSNMVSET